MLLCAAEVLPMLPMLAVMVTANFNVTECLKVFVSEEPLGIEDGTF